MATQAIDYKTEAVVNGIKLKFDSQKQKHRFLKSLNSLKAEANPVAETEAEANPVAEKWTAKKGEVEVEAEAEADVEELTVSEEQIQALQEKGWLKDYRHSNAHQTQENQEKVIDLPSGDGNDDETEVDNISVSGVTVPQAITNARWWNEGVSLFSGDAELHVQLDKKERVLIHMDSQIKSVKEEIGYPQSGRNDTANFRNAKEALKALVVDKLEERKGETFHYGNVVLKEFGATLRQRSINQPLRLVSWSIDDAPFDEGAIEVVVAFDLELNSAWKKVRGYGSKATLVPSDIFNFECHSPEEFVVMHSMSGLKGKPLDLVAFAHAVGGAQVNIREGVITPTNGPLAGKAFDLTKCNSVVDQWRNRNTKKVQISFDYARAEWEYVKAVDISEGVYGEGPGSEGYDVVSVEDVDDNTVRITAWIEMLVADMPLNVEVSLPEESSGVTQLTPEMLSVMTLQNKFIGEEMLALGATKRKSIVKLLNMFRNKSPKDCRVLCLQDEETLKELSGILKEGMNDKQVIRAYEKHFPKGVVFETKGLETVHRQYFDFEAIQGIAAFIGGSGDGVSHSIAEFFRTTPLLVGKPGIDSQVHAAFALLCNSTRAWFKVQLESKSLRKKLVSGLKGTAFGLKVRTLAIPELHHEGAAPNCIPKAALNPHDEILREMARNPWDGNIPKKFCDKVDRKAPGKAEYFDTEYLWGDDDIPSPKEVKYVFNPYKLNGEIISVFRTPMPMQGACEVVVTPKVGVGHLGLLMHVWAAFNEGDSDGDGIALVPAMHYFDKQGLSQEEKIKAALAMNQHPMGMAGYAFCYGEDWATWPCAEFCSHTDAWMKKKIIIEHGSKEEAYLVKKGILPYIRKVEALKWISSVGNVGSHYRNNVGKSYNISVIAVNRALETQYKLWQDTGSLTQEEKDKLNVQLKNRLELCAISWRLLYEGLGLAGYSDGAAKWFEMFRLAGWTNYYVEGLNGIKPLWGKEKVEGRKTFIHGLVEELEKANDFEFVNRKVIGAGLVKISQILTDIDSIENPGKSQGRTKRFKALTVNPSAYQEAIIRRTQRLCSQGDDKVLGGILEQQASQAEEDFDNFDEESGGPSQNSCLKLFLSEGHYEGVVPKWQRLLLKKAAAFTKASLELTSG